jgi:F0F1-type ATP synthase assembly protein I
VKNVGKDNNEKSKKKKKEKKNGRAKTVGGRQIRDETSGKDKKCWPKKKKKKKKNYSDLHQILFFLSRVLRVEGIGILVFRSNVSFLFFFYILLLLGSILGKKNIFS